ncbi:MAG: Crp/Fnr family transcriptional regulator [Saprospiraceae bacterium]|nr:Crp/Fnr family transcriptional regulator [Saprospiraceae bacterium]
MDLDIAFKNIARIVQLTENEKEIFKSLAEVITVKRKTHLLREGQICRFEYFILEGCLRSYYTDRSLVEHTTMFAIEGWWTGNLKSFVRNTPSEFNLVAQENSKVLRFTKEKLEKLYAKVPKFERFFRVLLQNRLLATQDRISQHLSFTASQRYLQFISKYPQIEQRVPLKHIASYLGITATYLSRLRRARMNNKFLH